ncbi:MAG TPA: hypothetical protein VF637_17385 [Sphingomicrobium sp.]
MALRLKYGGRIAYADTVAQAMARLMPNDTERIVPVPLHRWRLWARGYNQALLIARGLGRITGLDVDGTSLTRTRSSGSMRGAKRRQRQATVRGAFAVRYPDAIAGKRIVLVDDIHASGATADACTRALLQAGAATVDILCWARVIDDDASP